MQKPGKTILLAPIFLAVLLIVPVAASAQILGTFSGDPDQPGPTITSIFRSTKIPMDPNAPIWQDAPMSDVLVQGQNITIPILFNPSVNSVNVRSMHNGTWIGFWMEWSDESESTAALATHQFRDSIGVVFPVADARTFIAMGGPNTPVHIMHWKADWQKDIDLNHYQDREDAYPNMAYDLYLGKNEEQGEVFNYDPETQDFEEQGTGDPRIPVTKLNPDYQPGLAAGNTLSQLEKFTPIEELVAEGFGTLTPQEEHNALGKGVWENGIWKVVILRPMLTGDTTDKQLRPGEKTDIALAVWDGGNMEVNGRKSVALWHNLIIEAGEPGMAPPAPTQAPAAEDVGDSTAIVVGGIIAAVGVGVGVAIAARRRAAPAAVAR